MLWVVASELVSVLYFGDNEWVDGSIFFVYASAGYEFLVGLWCSVHYAFGFLVNIVGGGMVA